MKKSDITNKGKKVLVGLSGGVDSTAAAFLLKAQGFDVVGMYFDVIGNQEKEREEAENIAKQLDIPFIFKNVADEFIEIMDYFCESYHNGETPNPCIRCNPEVKFAGIMDEACKIGADYIATGHYAKVGYNENSQKYFIKMAENVEKDQSYMLYRLEQDVLKNLLLPLGDVKSKESVRELLRENNISNSEERDSQEICFIKNGSYVEFIKNWGIEKEKRARAKILQLRPKKGFYADYRSTTNLAEDVLQVINSNMIESSELDSYKNYFIEPGNFVDKTGKVLGTHAGIVHYTVGQRKGLGVTFGKPVFVTKVDHNENTVTLGDEADLFTETVYSKDNIFVDEDFVNLKNLTAKIRYASKPAKVKVTLLEDGRAEASFEEDQRAATPGQSIVFYSGDVVIGGGIIV